MPSKADIKTDIEFLHSLEEGQVMSQMTLSKRIGVSIGFTNALLKRAIHKGYVKAKSAPYKRYAYYLTPIGFGEKSRLVVEYLNTSLSFFKNARRQYAELFEHALNREQNRIVLLGGGELAEIAIMAAWNSNIELLAVVDISLDCEKIGHIPVIESLDKISGYDALLLTDSNAPQATYEKINQLNLNTPLIVPSFLRVHTRETPGNKDGGGL